MCERRAHGTLAGGAEYYVKVDTVLKSLREKP